MALTENELTSIISAVLSAIKTNSRTIEQLTLATSLNDDDSIEISNGRRITFGVLKNLVGAIPAGDLDSMKSQIANKELKSVQIVTGENAATIIIESKGKQISTTIPIATTKEAGFMTPADKTKLQSAYDSVQSVKNDVADIREKAEFVAKEIKDLQDGLGEAGGLVMLNSSGYIPSRFIPNSYDDVLEFDGVIDIIPTPSTIATTGPGKIVFCRPLQCFLLEAPTVPPQYFTDWKDSENSWGKSTEKGKSPVSGKVYVDISTNMTYRWGGSTLVTIGSGLALGHTEETAFPGNEGAVLQERMRIAEGQIEAARTTANAARILPIDGKWDGTGKEPTYGVWLCANNNGGYEWRSFGNTNFYDLPEERYNTDESANPNYIYRLDSDLYKIVNGNLVSIAGSAVGNTYNVTNEIPLPVGEYYSDISAEKPEHDVLKAVYGAGKASTGLTITFAIGPGSWKTYQYVGPNTTEQQFTKAENWIDLAGMSAGDESIININTLCDDRDYTLSNAIQALIEKEKDSGIAYRKEGLVITYRRNSNPVVWETKQYQGRLSDMDSTNEEQWKDFGGGGSDVEATDTIEPNSKKAITSGAVYEALKTRPIVNFDDKSNAENYVFQGVNDNGEEIGDPITIPRSNGAGSQSGSTLNIYPETQAVWGAFGARITLRAAIKSVSYDGDSEILGTIRTVAILDALTKMPLWSDTVNVRSSASATDYKFEFDFTDFITSASAKEFIIQATDADGNTKTRTITVTAVDVTCSCINTLNYSTSTALDVNGREKSLPMYRFTNNVSTKQGISVKTEIYYNGEWRVLGTAIVTDTYSHNVSVNPTNLLGGGEKLTHGSYPIRIQGTDVASGVEGNIVYTAIMCVDATNETPIVSIRYNDINNGKVRLYDSVSVDVAAYTSGKTNTPVEVYFDGMVITSVNCATGQTYNVSKQVQGYTADGTKQLHIYAQSAGVQSQTITLTVEGSAIDATIKEGALFSYDFSTRSNNENDHTISDGGYTMAVQGVNWSSNGFVNVLGEQAFRIAENVKAEIPFAPFSSAALETAGMAVQFAFSTKSIKDKDAKLMECYDSASGAGFYIKGNEIVISVLNGTPKQQSVKFKNNEKVTVAVVVEPGSKYVTYTAGGSGSGTNYSFMKLYVNGEECAAIGYQPNTSALRQSKNITFDSTNGDINLNYFLAYNSYMEWLQAFQNYLVKLSNVNAMIAEYDKENVLDTTGKPSLSMMAAKGIPYYVIVADQTTFNNFDYVQNGGTSTSDKFTCTLFYYNPEHPEVDFKATNVLWRRQGTTSAQRPIKNDRFNFNKKAGNGLMPSVELLTPDDSTELGRKAIEAVKHNKVYVSEKGFFVDVVTVKVDYSDSSNANDCGVCDMMNATFRALGSQYMTPAQRAFTGIQDLGGGDQLTNIQMDHSTKNHPVAVFRATQETLQDAWFHAKGNWKEDKGEQTALGFQNTPGYNLGCLNYGDFIEYFGNKGETLAQIEQRFKQEVDLNTDKVYLISQYCGRDYAIYRYKSGAWTRSTGSMKQVGGQWVVTGDVLNPVSGYELLQYAGMDWWQGVSSVDDMMALTEQKSSWVTKLGLANETYPAWTYYFECMIDDDQLQIDLALGKKVPYDLYNMLQFFNSCDYSKVDGWQKIWRENAYKYMSLESAMAYTGFTDYLAAVDQRAKNMQPMFFLEDGCSVVDGVYSGYRGMEPTRMYLNKVYDCDTCNGADNDGGRDIDPEVDPNKPTNEAEGYTNPYMGSGSVLFNNIDKEPEIWNSNDNGATTISLQSVINRMRNQTSDVDGKTMVPFSPDGALYYFVEKRLKFWPKVISSYDGERKYIDHTNIANLPYFYALHGLGLTSLPRFIEQRWAIRDGYYQTGDFFTNPLSGRVSAISENSKIHITAAATGYFGIGNDASGQLSETVFLEAGQSHSFTKFAHDAGALLYIYQPGRMSKIDLSEMSLAFHFDDLSKLELAEEIILGGDKHTANTALNGFNALGSIVLGDMPFLRKLDVSNTTATSIDAKGCPRIESINAANTPLATCNIAQTAPIESLTLPATMTSLELVNLPKLTYPGGLAVASFANISRMWIEGCDAINTATLIGNIADAGAVRELRIPDINVTASVVVLRKLRNSGAIGLDVAGSAYEESGKCSGITGRWIMTELIDEEDENGLAGLNTLQRYFPELEVLNSQYSMAVYDDVEQDCENITNYDNNTGYDFNNDYVPSGHFKKLCEMSHAYRGTFDSARNVMKCEQLSDDDYNYMADGSPVDLTDNSGMGYDFFKHIPNHWYKGVNDFKNQRKYAFRSICASEPISTSKVIKRAKLSTLLTQQGVALVMSANHIGDEPITTSNTIMNVYTMDVDGMKQVRWHGINSTDLGCVFLDADGKIISLFTMGVTHALFDFIVGEDYIFAEVPAGAVKFMFTAQSGINGDLEEIAVDSPAVEAIEPDWVYCKESLVGIYGMSYDSFARARSISGKSVSRGTGGVTSGVWTYDEEGNVNPASPTGLAYTCLDCFNVCASRGKGYHAVSYEQAKTLANIFMELVGSRDLQLKCGYGMSASYTTGTQTISGYYLMDNSGNAVNKNINAHGNKTVLNSASGAGNLVFGIHNFFGCNAEWAAGAVVNATSYKQWKKDKFPASNSAYPTNKVWRIYDFTNDTERDVMGISATSGCIARLRFGRYMDIVPGMTTTNSQYNTHYADSWSYANSTARVLLRGGNNAGASCGPVYSNASYASSYSHSFYGSRLAFSGEIEFV